MSEDMMGDFHIEALELLDEAEESLLELDKGAEYKQCYNQIFRAFHSIKGAAGMFGIEKLQKHMHYLENLLSNKQDLNELSTLSIDYFLVGVDGARKILEKKEIVFDYHDPDQRVEPSTASLANSKNKQKTEKIQNAETKENSKGVVWAVDDEEDILDLLAIQLESKDYEVKTYLSPIKLLSDLEFETPDTIISDINMPEMNGVDLVKQVNAKRPHLPVIVLSGYVTKEVCLKVLRDGVTGIIEKPFEVEDFIKLVDVNVNRYQSVQLLNKSIDLLIYQFENFPAINGSEKDFFDHFRTELNNLLMQKNTLYKRLI